MYTDLYLKFPSPEVADSVLYRWEGIVEADEERGIKGERGWKANNYKCAVAIGKLRKKVDWQPGDPLDYLDGWHVNIRLEEDEDIEPLRPYILNPTTPRQVWV